MINDEKARCLCTGLEDTLTAGAPVGAEAETLPLGSIGEVQHRPA